MTSEANIAERKSYVFSWVIAIIATVAAVAVTVFFAASWLLGQRGPLLSEQQVLTSYKNWQLSGIGTVSASSIVGKTNEQYGKEIYTDKFCHQYVSGIAEDFSESVTANITADAQLPKSTNIKITTYLLDSRSAANKFFQTSETVVDKHCYGGNWGKIAVHEGGERGQRDSAKYYWRRIGEYDTENKYGYLITAQVGNTVTVLVIQAEKEKFNLDIPQIVDQISQQITAASRAE